jgi:hypothetical protein
MKAISFVAEYKKGGNPKAKTFHKLSHIHVRLTLSILTWERNQLLLGGPLLFVET